MIQKPQIIRNLSKWKIDGINTPIPHLLGIIFVILLSYSNTFNAPFHLDDDQNIVNNPVIRDFAYFTDASKIESISRPDINKHILKTRIFGYLTFAINYRLHGLDVRGYHLLNILIHIASSLLVYWLAALTFRTPYFSADRGGECSFSENSGAFVAVFTALLFAVHPIQTQAVTYIVQRFASLAAMLYLLSLVFYIKARLNQAKEEGKGFSASSLVFYLSSLCSAVFAIKTKEIAFTLPFVMLMYELTFFRGKITRRIVYLIPFMLAILMIPLSLAETGVGIGEKVSEASGAFDGVSQGVYLVTQFRVIVTYIRLLFFPINQNLDYDYPAYDSLFIPGVFISFLFLLLLAGLGIYLYRLSRNTAVKNRYLYRLISFGILWFIVTIAPESSIFPIKDLIFEHRVYLPSAGFFMAFTAAVELLRAGRADRAGSIRKWLQYGMVLLAAIFSITTYLRNDIWRDSISLWEDTVKGSPHKARPNSNLGVAYAAHGRFDEAINAYNIALESNIGNEIVRNNLGNAYLMQGRFDEAIAEYKAALILYPDYADAHYNLGATYHELGRITEAINEYKIVLKINPAHADAMHGLGVAYYDLGRWDEAVSEYTTALKINPDNADVRTNLGNAYYRLGRLDEAADEYKTALKINPDNADAHYNIGNIFYKRGQWDEAVNAYIKAVKINPDYVDAHYKLGNAYYNQGREDEAVHAYKAALKILPDYVDVHYNLGSVLAEMGRLDEAADEFKAILRLKPDDANARRNYEILAERIRLMKKYDKVTER